MLGLVDGERPDFPFPGNWLYVDGHPVIHLVGVDPADPSGLIEYLGNQDLGSLEGSGAVDHIAFRAENADALCARLDATGLPYRRRRVPGMNLFQLFVEDPNGVTVELNYWGEPG